MHHQTVRLSTTQSFVKPKKATRGTAFKAAVPSHRSTDCAEKSAIGGGEGMGDKLETGTKSLGYGNYG